MKDVKDLLDDTNYNFLSYTAFITKYKIKTNYLEYYKVVSALKHFRKKCSNNQNFTTLEKATDNLFSSEKVCKTFYQILIKRKTSSPVKSQGKWLAEDLFIKCTSELGKYLSATFSMYYRNEVKGISIQISA